MPRPRRPVPRASWVALSWKPLSNAMTSFAGHEPNDATPFLPERHSLKALREAAAGCRGCHLWRRATQTVFGEGAARARVMLIGEQPGDREDREGEPFVGPAGRELDRALEEAGIDRRSAYVTNVVKHSSSRNAASAGYMPRPRSSRSTRAGRGSTRSCAP